MDKTDKQNQIKDIVIVGGGPGGLTAAIYGIRAAMDLVLVEKGVAGGQVNNSFEVENWTGIERIRGAELARNFAEHAAFYGLEPLHREVVEVEPGLDCHCVHLDNGQKIDCHAVILATGGAPKKLNIPGEEENYGKGVSYCAVCDGFFFRDKTVIVVGGGDSATEESLYLAKIAKKVYLVHRRDRLRASMILQKKVLAEKKIEMRWNSVVREIAAESGGVTGAVLEKTDSGVREILPADGLFIFIGFSPNNRLVPAGTKKNADGFVMTDEKCMTNIEGIFAIGDLRDKYARQIITAAADGCTAALAAALYVENRKSV
jgi:thioredoxin reductase (NADPH)